MARAGVGGVGGLVAAVVLLAALAACGSERSGSAGAGDGGSAGTGGSGGTGGTDGHAGSGGDGGDPVEPGRVTVRVQDEGAPVSGMMIWLHDAAGAYTGGVTTGADGLAVIEDVPAAGIGITVPSSAIAPWEQGLSTILGLHAGDELSLGQPAAPPPVELTFTLPPAYQGASEHRISMPCRSFAVAPGVPGSATLNGCVSGATIPVVVEARGASGNVLATASVPSVPVDRTDPLAPIAHADLAAAGWQTEVAALRFVASGAKESTTALMQSSWPRPEEALGFHAVGPAALDPGASLDLPVRVQPGVGPVHARIFRWLDKDGETRNASFTRVLAPPAPGGAEALHGIDVNADLPSFAAGVSVSSAGEWIAVSVPTNGRCAGEVRAPDATVHILGGVTDKMHLQWRVLSPDAGSTFHLPELPAAARELWPWEELTSRQFVVLSTWISSGYADLLAHEDPIAANMDPRLEAGDHHCVVWTSGKAP